MLVLTRKLGESIIIGAKLAEVKVLTVDKRTGAIRLGIDAPKDLSVHREEVYHNIRDHFYQQNKDAIKNHHGDGKNHDHPDSEPNYNY